MDSKDKIRAALAESPCNFYQLMLRTGLSVSTINKCLAEMLGSGEVVEVHEKEIVEVKLNDERRS